MIDILTFMVILEFERKQLKVNYENKKRKNKS